MPSLGLALFYILSGRVTRVNRLSFGKLGCTLCLSTGAERSDAALIQITHAFLCPSGSGLNHIATRPLAPSLPEGTMSKISFRYSFQPAATLRLYLDTLASLESHTAKTCGQGKRNINITLYLPLLAQPSLCTLPSWWVRTFWHLELK